MSMETIVKKLINGQSLIFEEAVEFFEGIVHSSIDEKNIAEALISMSSRDVSASELSAAVSVMSKHSVKFIHNMRGTVDTCGTGGDGKKTINVSSAVAVILSSFNIPVIKHGNRAQSGFLGSADIFEIFGIPIELDTGSAFDYFDRHRFIFLFAPKYQPAMKKVAHIRKKIGRPTIFNFLGPLLNPGNPEFQIIGINKKDDLELYANTLRRLQRKNVIVYSSTDGFDEVSTSLPTKCYKIEDDNLVEFMIHPEDYFKPFSMPRVKSKIESKNMFYEALEGKNEYLTNLLSINASVAFSMINDLPLIDAFYEIKKHLSKGLAVKKLDNLSEGAL